MVVMVMVARVVMVVMTHSDPDPMMMMVMMVVTDLDGYLGKPRACVRGRCGEPCIVGLQQS